MLKSRPDAFPPHEEAARLRRELDAIAETIGIDYWNILDREAAARTPVLEVIKRELIRGEIVTEYTLVDDLVATKICEYFFPGRGMISLWKTKRFRRFNSDISGRGIEHPRRIVVFSPSMIAPLAIRASWETTKSLLSA
jgi:hypothetical protein